MFILAWVLFLAWLVLISVTFFGSTLSWTFLLRESAQRQGPTPPPADQPPISILKPLKGVEYDLKENLESVFTLNYPKFEILFNVAEENDPVIAVVLEMMEKYPSVDAQLTIGEVIVGYNPKVNNLILSYDKAKYDWQLILDSNIRVYPEYLNFLAAEIKPNTGCISTAFLGREPQGIGGWLERVFLSTMNTRWMILSQKVNQTFVVGKSMLFKKSQFERFGGLRYLGTYLAEDLMAGVKTVEIGLKVVVPPVYIYQYLGKQGFKSYWARHTRWARIRTAHNPLLFLVELLITCSMSGLLGSWAISYLTGLPMIVAFVGHFLLWGSAELLFMKGADASTGLKDIAAWMLQVFLEIPLWFHSLTSNKVSWRGTALALRHGGHVVSHAPLKQSPQELQEEKDDQSLVTW